MLSRCPACGCPGFMPLFFGGLCLWTKCIWGDPTAWDKATIDAWEYTVNGVPAVVIERYIKKLNGEPD